MTEAEWDACTEPNRMLEFLRGKASDRKLRLFSVGCCRHIWHLIPDECCRHAAVVAERFADGLATEPELRAAADLALQWAGDHSRGTHGQSFSESQSIYFAARTTAYAANATAHNSALCANRTLYVAAVGAAGDPDVNMLARDAASDAVNEYRKKLLRDIFGPLPFRPVAIDPTWLAWKDRTIPKMAQAIYDDRTVDRMPIMADALQEAGCNNHDILGHCREPAEHVRGCWLIDALLSKE